VTSTWILKNIKKNVNAFKTCDFCHSWAESLVV